MFLFLKIFLPFVPISYVSGLTSMAFVIVLDVQYMFLSLFLMFQG